MKNVLNRIYFMVGLLVMLACGKPVERFVTIESPGDKVFFATYIVRGLTMAFSRATKVEFDKRDLSLRMNGAGYIKLDSGETGGRAFKFIFGDVILTAKNAAFSVSAYRGFPLYTGLSPDLLIHMEDGAAFLNVKGRDTPLTLGYYRVVDSILRKETNPDALSYMSNASNGYFEDVPLKVFAKALYDAFHVHIEYERANENVRLYDMELNIRYSLPELCVKFSEGPFNFIYDGIRGVVRVVKK